MIRRFNNRAECITFDEVFQKLGFTHEYKWVITRNTHSTQKTT
ncbi:hypothetical protein BMW23_0720 [Bodo saltans virus]|uniref:Uncharacterized protein n=1 Tax=Bodo saltans virus TaxID=2024608 RepID=A0A2H4UV87_9VIRU|nr:hypothetical protein QJ851_gp0703 [Bodo saltans virus]ATZ80766.1 hypothetical protein BMW23_0720 [Bodo saltans virus]